MTHDDELAIWTVCRFPTDFPDKFTARKSLILAGRYEVTSEVYVADTLAAIRAQMEQMGLTPLPRDPADDPIIVESWI